VAARTVLDAGLRGWVWRVYPVGGGTASHLCGCPWAGRPLRTHVAGGVIGPGPGGVPRSGSLSRAGVLPASPDRPDRDHRLQIDGRRARDAEDGIGSLLCQGFRNAGHPTSWCTAGGFQPITAIPRRAAIDVPDG